jgi:hypothetical protein
MTVVDAGPCGRRSLSGISVCDQPAGHTGMHIDSRLNTSFQIHAGPHDPARAASPVRLLPAPPAPAHRVTFEIETDDLTGRIHCDAPATAECHRSCAEGCETWGDVSDDGNSHEMGDGTVHAMRSHEYCNVVEYISNGDDLEVYYDGDRMPAHDGPVLVSWDGDAYVWHYADQPEAVQP